MEGCDRGLAALPAHRWRTRNAQESFNFLPMGGGKDPASRTVSSRGIRQEGIEGPAKALEVLLDEVRVTKDSDGLGTVRNAVRRRRHAYLIFEG